MRFLIFCLLTIGCVATSAWAEQPSYPQQIRAHLASHRMPYPRVTVAERNKATPLVVEFLLDRDGKLLDSQITKTSGSAKFDQASLDWLATLQPFPAIPTDRKAPEKFTLPIHFALSPYGGSYEESEKKIKQMIGNVCKGC